MKSGSTQLNEFVCEPRANGWDKKTFIAFILGGTMQYNTMQHSYNNSTAI